MISISVINGLYLLIQIKVLLKEIVIAVQSWGEAEKFIKKHQLFKLIFWPGIIYTLLFILGMFFFWASADNVVSWISRQWGVEVWLQKERNSWLSFAFVMTGMMLRLILVFFYFSLFKYLILIIGSPLFAYLSEKTEAIIKDKKHEVNRAELKKDCIRSSKLAIRNCGFQSIYMIGLILLSLVPVIGWITPIIALLLEGYYFGFSMLDYSFARAGFSQKESIAFTRKQKGLAIGNGLLFYLMHVVIILAPAYAIIASTLCVHKIKDSQS